MGFRAMYGKKVASKEFATKDEAQAFINKRHASKFIPSGMKKLAMKRWSVVASSDVPKPAPVRAKTARK